ncbi:alpha/beta hydrolase [Mucilaginibacter robiniae]|uniref:Alpha/beta hydrolase n=1 Tax=Mucilaginibacter robiniae TaxID=2728022 RepID=A0A7L5E2N3_9SPHI|nr:alpha/beta hydrolase [Mucilaginibacter robiniae]QJD94606.1 alpha/beta hydrolase [Mucilaginibacter robiniae]
MENPFSTDKVVQWGNNGPVLVFLHYYGGSAQTWQWVAQKLADQYRCVAINLPGFGGAAPLEKPSIANMAADIEQQLQYLGITDYTLIGHSMGGKIAMQMAANPGNTIKKLVLLAPSPPTFEKIPEKEIQRMLDHPSGEAAAYNIKKNTIQPLGTEQYALAIDTNYMADGSTWRWWPLEGINHSIADLTKSLTMPVTVIASKDDAAITYEMVTDEVMPNLPSNTRLITTHGIGHLYPLEAPGWLAELLKIVLAK